VLYLCFFATASAVLFHAFNTAVTSYQASYDFNVKAERYKRFLFRVEVSYRGFASWFRIAIVGIDGHSRSRRQVFDNTAVASFLASYDVDVIVERYGRFLYCVVVSRRVGIDSHSNSHVNYTQLIYVYANRAHNL